MAQAKTNALVQSVASNAMTVYGNVTNPIDFCEKMGNAYASLLNCTAEQGKAIALTCMCEGLTPIGFQKRYHIIQGKPAMRADAMLAEFRMNYGGDYEFNPKTDRTPNRAAIKLIDFKGREYEFEYTIQDAEDSRWPWKDAKDHSKGLKDNWSTPSDKKNMLWARLISDSLRAVCPELVAGVYTPEEVGDVIEGELLPPKTQKTAEEIIAEKKAEQQPPVQHDGPQEPAAPEEEIDAEFEDAEFEIVEDASVENSLSGEVRELFVEAFGEAAPSAINDVCKRRGVSVLHNLSYEQLSEIADKLRVEIASQGN